MNEFVLSNIFFEPQYYLKDSGIPILPWYILRSVVIAAIEMLLSQEVLLMTLFITEVVDDILLAVLIIHSLWKYLFWGMTDTREIAK